MLKLKDYIDFYKIAKRRAKSSSDYFNFENFQSEIVIKSLKSKGVSFNGKRVLDVGSGTGGYSLNLLNNGAKVVALDIIKDYFQNVKGVGFVLGDAANMPFKSNIFDFVFCSSLVEHVKEPDELIREIKRILRKNGMCYLSFPPFWSPVGAHQFKPFHYLGENIAIKLSRKLYDVRSFRYDDEYGKLYIRTIRQVRKLILKNSFQILSMTTRMSPINFARIPLIGDFFTWHVEFLIKK